MSGSTEKLQYNSAFLKLVKQYELPKDTTAIVICTVCHCCVSHSSGFFKCDDVFLDSVLMLHVEDCPNCQVKVTHFDGTTRLRSFRKQNYVQ